MEVKQKKNTKFSSVRHKESPSMNWGFSLKIFRLIQDHLNWEIINIIFKKTEQTQLRKKFPFLSMGELQETKKRCKVGDMKRYSQAKNFEILSF